MSEVEKLLPCPFCGGEPEVEYAFLGHVRQATAKYVFCNRCEFSMPAKGWGARALTPTDERVEAVARAMFDFDYAISNTELDYEHEWILSRRNYVKLARAAIAAMGVTITPESANEQ